MSETSFFARGSCLALLSTCVWIASARHADAASLEAFLPQYRVSSAIPPNGDLNPYGVAFVPAGFPGGGIISAADVLVSNFNDLNNCQGQGTTIIKFTPNNVAAPDSVAPGVAPGQMGNATAFFQSPKLVGLSTALGVLRGGFVIVGNVPSGPESNGPSGPVCSPTPSSGALQVIDRHGKLIATLTDPVGNVFGSPWDLTIANDTGSTAQLFVSNVLKGTVGRLDLAVSAAGVSIVRSFVVAQGYEFRLDSAAFVVPDGTRARSGRQSFRSLDRRQQDLQGSKCQPAGAAGSNQGDGRLQRSAFARTIGVDPQSRRHLAHGQRRRGERRSDPSSTEGREALRTVLEFLHAGDVLMVTRIDRFARSIGELQDSHCQGRAALS
jgi:hypothetical protein